MLLLRECSWGRPFLGSKAAPAERVPVAQRQPKARTRQALTLAGWLRAVVDDGAGKTKKRKARCPTIAICAGEVEGGRTFSSGPDADTAM